MQYAIFVYADAAFEAGPGNPEWDAAMPGHAAFAQAVAARGLTQVAGAALHGASTATSIRTVDGERLVTDGPFAETKEQLWGYHVVEAPDLDTVIELAQTFWEAEHGTVEIRPLLELGAPAPAA